MTTLNSKIAIHALLLTSLFSAAWAQAQDVVIDGSLCVGFDCSNPESFGFDTIRLKENNLRIKAQDTSNTASFATNDWQITFNDTSNGGANKFSIDDIDGGRTPFTIEASAPTNSLYVDDGGRVGFGTNTPVVELHIKDGDTPTVRLEQDGSSGFTPQTWDIAGNETNFFIRDASNGSTLPFRIRLGAPTSAIDISATGDVGIGTSSPDEKLTVAGSIHIRDDAASATKFILENTNTTTPQAAQFRLLPPSSNRRLLARNGQPGAAGNESQIIFGDNGNFSFIGESATSGACIQLRDADDLGDTHCVTDGGSLNCSAGPCP